MISANVFWRYPYTVIVHSFTAIFKSAGFVIKSEIIGKKKGLKIFCFMKSQRFDKAKIKHFLSGNDEF